MINVRMLWGKSVSGLDARLFKNSDDSRTILAFFGQLVALDTNDPESDDKAADPYGSRQCRGIQVESRSNRLSQDRPEEHQDNGENIKHKRYFQQGGRCDADDDLITDFSAGFVDRFNLHLLAALGNVAGASGGAPFTGAGPGSLYPGGAVDHLGDDASFFGHKLTSGYCGTNLAYQLCGLS